MEEKIKDKFMYQLIITIPFKEGEEMELNLNRAIDSLSDAIKNKGLVEMDLKAHDFETAASIYNVTIKQQPNINDGFKDIDELLLSKANEIGLEVDFSDKTYDGDKEAPMDRYGFLEYLLNHKL